jgi:hypothetical protein
MKAENDLGKSKIEEILKANKIEYRYDINPFKDEFYFRIPSDIRDSVLEKIEKAFQITILLI